MLKRHFQFPEDVNIQNSDIQEVTMQPQEKFRIDTFNNLIDMVLGSLEERFNQLKRYNDDFSLFNKLNTITDMSRIEIRNFCLKLERVIDFKDIDGLELSEIWRLSEILPKKVTPLNCLNSLFESGLTDLFPNFGWHYAYTSSKCSISRNKLFKIKAK